MRKLFILLTLALSLEVGASRKVHATVYNAVPEQTNSDPGHTAFMFELDLDNPYKHKIIAVSRDLLKEYPKGTLVCVEGTAYDGVYVVMDKMNKRYTNRIDLLINQEMQIGNWPNATIRKYDSKG
jgi:3D (Asp-Asp-Asp) domain-containing protein